MKFRIIASVLLLVVLFGIVVVFDQDNQTSHSSTQQDQGLKLN